MRIIFLGELSGTQTKASPPSYRQVQPQAKGVHDGNTVLEKIKMTPRHTIWKVAETRLLVEHFQWANLVSKAFI
jgi:hypothetical protein